ncbi:MAG: hypothetical protein HY225_02995 [Candidatus Vogelbacteria bacterium]|nr:hypothetical protein [Candidatus Vogelbacteria bacterium]
MDFLNIIYCLGAIFTACCLIYKLSSLEFIQLTFPDLLLILVIIWIWPVYLVGKSGAVFKRLGDWIWRSISIILGVVVGFFVRRKLIMVDKKISIELGPHCPICAEDFKIHNKAKRCPSCKVLFHPDCVEWNAGLCAIYGCGTRVSP